jgi:hypothetical protein
MTCFLGHYQAVGGHAKETWGDAKESGEMLKKKVANRLF